MHTAHTNPALKYNPFGTDEENRSTYQARRASGRFGPCCDGAHDECIHQSLGSRCTCLCHKKEGNPKSGEKEIA